MQFTLYRDVHAFHRDTFETLMRHQAQNLIIIGNQLIGLNGRDKSGWRDPATWIMATVSDARGVRLTAMMTPPHNIALYATDNVIDTQAIDCLIDGLQDIPIPGVTSDTALAEAFADAFTARRGKTHQITMQQRIYRLDAVNPAIPRIGTLRPVNEGDMHWFPYWCEAFTASTHYGSTEMSVPQDGDGYRQLLASGRIHVLETDGHPVSMAGFSREIPAAVCVSHVYTPPYFRARGYASSCVAQLSELGLKRGFSGCVLYTDLANPTSNSIYQKIGYRSVCDSRMLRFI